MLVLAPTYTHTYLAPVRVYRDISVWSPRGGRSFFCSDCPAGGVGVDVWAAKDGDPFSSPSLTSVTLEGNGGDGDEDGCEKGGGLLVTATTTTASTTAAATLETGGGGAGEKSVAASGGGGAPVQTAGQERQDGGPHGQAAPLLSLSLSGCTLRNNTARLGGGIAIGPATSSSPPLSLSSVSLETAETVENPPTSAVPLDEVPTARRQEGGGETPNPGGTAAAGGGSGPDSAGGTVSMAGSRVLPGGRARGCPAAENSSEGGGVVLSVVMDGATVVSGNRATSGGGVWAKGAAVSAVGGKVVVRGNVAGVLEESCGEEVGGKR